MSDTLYRTLPAILRLRDAERGEPLRALLEVLEREGGLVADDIDRLYENLFVETADEWAVPYLGDLLGARGLADPGARGFSVRARVANTLAYRRRKGTAAMLEQLALDVTGWRSRAVEYFELLSTTQWLQHPRPHARRTPDLRYSEALDRLGGAFEEASHAADVRRIATGRGRHNLPHIGLWLWRLQSYRLRELDARPAPDAGGAPERAGRYFLHPLAVDAPLFHRPRAEDEIETLATEREVPAPLRRWALHRETDRLRRGTVDGATEFPEWFDEPEPAAMIAYRFDPADPFMWVPPAEILIADLSAPTPAPPEGWLRPPANATYRRRRDGVEVPHPLQVALDPALGRLAFPAGVVPAEVRVAVAHGFPGDVGGGAYDRRDSVAEFPLGEVTWQAGVGRDLPHDPAERLFRTLGEAIAAWNALPAGTFGVIALVDNGTYVESLPTLHVRGGSRLLMVAADWPQEPDGAGTLVRRVGRLVPMERRAHVVGELAVRSGAAAELWIDGPWLEGDLTLEDAGGAGLARLRLAHATVVPGRGQLAIGAGHEQLRVELVRAICGPIASDAPEIELAVRDSIIDAGDHAAAAVTLPSGHAELAESTVVGTVDVQRFDASNSLCTGRVVAARRQTGCVRFSFVPAGSLTPRRFRCQPDLALAAADGDAAAEALALARTVPDFVGESLAHPAYRQLARRTPESIRAGADDGAEMGVWHHLRQPQREANLRASLDEFLRLGLEAGPLFAT
jgi:hypothetical protein